MKNFEATLRPVSASKDLVSREVGFQLNTSDASYRPYSPFYDIHMREYWLSPPTRKRLVNLGFLTKDESQLIDPDKERMRLASVEKHIQMAEKVLEIQRQKRTSKLYHQAIYLKRQIVHEYKRKEVRERSKSRV